MQEEDLDCFLKVIVVGNGQVGKTSMITKFATGDFTGQYKKTIGTDFMERVLDIPSKGKSIKLMLWDTAGQEMFSEITRNYYRGAGAVVYAFSSVDRDSFEAVEKWRSRVHDECGSTIAEVLIQTKCDLLSTAVVTPTEAETLAKKLNLKLYRVCTKENRMVEDVFLYLCESYLGKSSSGTISKKQAPQTVPEPKGHVVNLKGAEEKAKSPSENRRIEPSRRRTGGKKELCLVM